MQATQLYHISQQDGITLFNPRPSPQPNENIAAALVYAITNQLLHNYLLPRDCPRVCFYKGPTTTQLDAKTFFAHTTAKYVVAVESGWFTSIAAATLYCYQVPHETFTLLDECAGYYISYQAVVPNAVMRIDDIVEELLRRDVELRFTPNLWPLAEAVKQSTLQFSLIRMRNATPHP